MKQSWSSEALFTSFIHFSAAKLSLSAVKVWLPSYMKPPHNFLIQLNVERLFHIIQGYPGNKKKKKLV